MVKYYIDREAYDYLCEWSEQRITKVIFCPEYHKKVQLVLKGYDSVFRFYAEAKTYGYKYNLLDDDGLIIKGRITHTESTERDFDIHFDLTRDYDDDIKHILQVYCTAFLQANCFMWYGNIIDDKQYTVAGKSTEKDKIYTFRKFKDSVYAVSVGHHRSPEGVFQVRGHFRQYKSGKVIWIDSYLKGLDE